MAINGSHAGRRDETDMNDLPLLPPRENNEPSPEPNPQLSLWPLEKESNSSDSLLTPVGPDQLPAREPPWSLIDLFQFVAFAAVSFIIANLLAVAVFSALRHRYFPQVNLDQFLTATPWVVSLQIGWEMLWLLFIYGTVTLKYNRGFWKALKWTPGPRSGATYLAAGVVLSIVTQLPFSLFPSEKHLPIEKLFTSPESGYLLAFFGVCVAPFVEEMVFRGFFYPVFERMWGFVAAVLLTALLFAAIHVPQLSGGWQEIIAIFFVGMVFSYCRGKTGSLVPPFLMHLAYNASLFISLYFSTDQFRTLKG